MCQLDRIKEYLKAGKALFLGVSMKVIPQGRLTCELVNQVVGWGLWNKKTEERWNFSLSILGLMGLVQSSFVPFEVRTPVIHTSDNEI